MGALSTQDQCIAESLASGTAQSTDGRNLLDNCNSPATGCPFTSSDNPTGKVHNLATEILSPAGESPLIAAGIHSPTADHSPTVLSSPVDPYPADCPPLCDQVEYPPRSGGCSFPLQPADCHPLCEQADYLPLCNQVEPTNSLVEMEAPNSGCSPWIPLTRDGVL
ncbi:hypothetical protein AAC387_Pa10g0459 [Persea americana]